MSLKESFEIAVAESKQLAKRPDDDTLLKIYSLYKQATEGDIPADTPAPGMFDFVNKAKQDAWKKLTGTSADEAMEQYISTINALKTV
ncbi:acyl-CoA-binding protein [Mucilaginibacter phyllosphaerae]|uniref:Acyl-CoA-binding protein n=1 Tax=Mucilaginibacter phyllosphaerae TaxID=1812349 RepID=A0A4Y8A7T5_9SPHI|nr:acyl-CoA-binding protein [Mucilaginibacter phyllosphaerae]MBB3971132.1 acyl-CoA-binding protein [Mucilaginibacter phyllosphaerae]TEW63861.1 acyl-CoA-binding protein [Mucilaginibacter phyllosphaerae]GGH22668.1 acyl-CoA-binding protein [Mucilaginibacter phyllosphaerae]